MVVNDTLAARLTAEYGLKTSMVPRNFREGRLDDVQKRAFLDSFGIGLIVDDETVTTRDLVPERWLFSTPAGCGPGAQLVAPKMPAK